MKVLYIVNTADAQSIPLELGKALKAQAPDISVAAYYKAGVFADKTASHGVKIFNAARFCDPQAIRRLSRHIEAYQPDIVHVHHFASALVSSVAARRLNPGMILVKTEHNDHRHLPLHHRITNPVLLGLYSCIIGNSDTTLRSFSRLEALRAGARTTRIHNGVDIERVRRLSRAAPRSARTVIGTVGRLVAQKNQENLLRAFARAVRTRGLDAHLELVGEGPLRARLERTSSELGIEPRVTFLGALSRDDVYRRLGAWHGFVMPSFFEGFCNALVEAIASGLPVACSRLDTLEEVVGPSALTFCPRDITEMSEAIVGLLEGSHAARPEVAEKYDIRNAVSAHLELYTSLLSKGRVR